MGIWCQNDVVSTSMRRNHVASTLIRRHFKSCARWEESACLICKIKWGGLNVLQNVVVLIYSQPELIISSTAIYIHNKNNKANWIKSWLKNIKRFQYTLIGDLSIKETSNPFVLVSPDVFLYCPMGTQRQNDAIRVGRRHNSH